MSKVPILHPDQSYTFRSYFEMSFEPEDILAEFGYSFQRASLNLEQSTVKLERNQSVHHLQLSIAPYYVILLSMI